MSHRHHPYRPPARFFPAGFRITDYVPMRTPSDPAQDGTRPSDDDNDAPPASSFDNFFPGDFFGSPQRPTTPAPNHHQKARPQPCPPEGPCPIPPPRRKYKLGRRSSSANLDHRPRDVPPHRRAQWLKKKRTALCRKQADSFERRAARAREDLLRLVDQAEALMRPECMTRGDSVFLRELANLDLDQKLGHDLEICRQQIIRAAAGTRQRRMEHKARDREAERLWAEKESDALYRQEEEEAMRADQRRQRAHDAAERKIREEQERHFRQELARKAKEEEERQRQEEERRRQEEEERRLQEERRRREVEERARRLNEEIERARRTIRERLRRQDEEIKQTAEYYRRRREADERRAREEKERLAREEEERQARMRAEQARRAAEEEQLRQYFLLYEAKWTELRTKEHLPPIDVREMPWPVFGAIFSAEQITYEGVKAFLFHPQRPGMEGKTARDKVKAEVLRFHPDKYNTRIVPKVYPPHQAVAQEIAGAIARVLTTIMTEESEENKT